MAAAGFAGAGLVGVADALEAEDADGFALLMSPVCAEVEVEDEAVVAELLAVDPPSLAAAVGLGSALVAGFAMIGLPDEAAGVAEDAPPAGGFGFAEPASCPWLSGAGGLPPALAADLAPLLLEPELDAGDPAPLRLGFPRAMKPFSQSITSSHRCRLPIKRAPAPQPPSSTILRIRPANSSGPVALIAHAAIRARQHHSKSAGIAAGQIYSPIAGDRKHSTASSIKTEPVT